MIPLNKIKLILIIISLNAIILTYFMLHLEWRTYLPVAIYFITSWYVCFALLILSLGILVRASTSSKFGMVVIFLAFAALLHNFILGSCQSTLCLIGEESRRPVYYITKTFMGMTWSLTCSTVMFITCFLFFESLDKKEGKK